MAKNKISEWSSTPANNTDVGGIDIAEGCAPSGINNAIREVMAQVKDMITGADGDSQVVGGNLTVNGTSTLTGAVTASGGVSGNLTGNVTGNLTGASTGAHNGTVGATTPTTVVGTTITANSGFVGNLTGNVTGNASGLSATLAVASGGTGSTSLTANNVLLGNGTSAVQAVAPSTSGNVLTSNGTTWTSAAPTAAISLTSSQATTSGNTVTITGIPSTAIRVTFILNGVSTNGSSVPVIRVGNSSGLISSGYVGVNGYGFGSGTVQNSSGFSVSDNYDPSLKLYGTITISKFDSSNWSMTGNIAIGSNKLATGSSFVSVSGSLDRVGIITSNTFNAGSVAVIYE